MNNLEQIRDLFRGTESLFGSNDFNVVVGLLTKYELFREDISNDNRVIVASLLTERFKEVRGNIEAIKHNKQAVIQKTHLWLIDYEERISKLLSLFEKEPVVGLTIKYKTKGKNRQLKKEEIELLISTLSHTKDIHLPRLKKTLLGDISKEDIQDVKVSIDYPDRSFQKDIAKKLFQSLEPISENSERRYLFIAEFMFLAGCPFYDNKGEVKQDFNEDLFRQHVKNLINRG